MKRERENIKEVETEENNEEKCRRRAINTSEV